jgi:hypothetical protein
MESGEQVTPLPASFSAINSLPKKASTALSFDGIDQILVHEAHGHQAVSKLL